MMMIRFLSLIILLFSILGCSLFFPDPIITPYDGYFQSDWTFDGSIISSNQSGTETKKIGEVINGINSLVIINLDTPDLENVIISKNIQYGTEHVESFNTEWETMIAMSSFIDSNNDRYTAYISIPTTYHDSTLKFYKQNILLSSYAFSNSIYATGPPETEYDKYVQINPFTKQSFLFSFGYTKLFIFSITGDLEHELELGSHATWKTATSFWYYDPIQNKLASYELGTATSTMYDIDFKPSYYNHTDNTLQTIDNGVLKTYSVASNTITDSIPVIYDYKTLNEFKFSPDGSKLLVYKKGYLDYTSRFKGLTSLGINVYDINTHTLTKIRD